jgi:hypothetical protein
VYWITTLVHNLEEKSWEMDPKFLENMRTSSSSYNDGIHIEQYNCVLEAAGIVFVEKEETQGAIVLTRFLKSVVQSLWKYRPDFRRTQCIFQRMMWVLRHNCDDVRLLLGAFVLAACPWKKGDYDVEMKAPRPIKNGKHPIKEHLKTSSSSDLSWDDQIRRTKMGSNRDFNEFNKILSNDGLSLDGGAAAVNQETKTLFCFLSELANFGRCHGLQEYTYQRMMMVISKGSALSYEDVLRAFFMSMCTYKRDVNSVKEQDVTMPPDEEAKIKKARCE